MLKCLQEYIAWCTCIRTQYIFAIKVRHAHSERVNLYDAYLTITANRILETKKLALERVTFIAIEELFSTRYNSRTAIIITLSKATNLRNQSIKMVLKSQIIGL